MGDVRSTRERAGELQNISRKSLLEET